MKRRLKTMVALSALLSAFSVSAVLALDRDAIQGYMSQVQSLQSEIAKEQGVQTDLLRTKELLLESDRTNKQETAKLKHEEANFVAEVNAYKADKATRAEEQKRFDAELASLKAQRDQNQQAIAEQTGRYHRHQSWKPDPYNHAAVNAYNAEADQLNSQARSLNAVKAQLDVARDRILNWADRLDNRQKALEQKRLALVERNKALERKENDLKWARDKISEQTLKWTQEMKRNNARLEELAVQLNAVLTKVSQLSSNCSSISGVGNLDLGNLNSGSEQASRCLQQLWDRASAGDTRPVRPRPPSQVRPNR